MSTQDSHILSEIQQQCFSAVTAYVALLMQTPDQRIRQLLLSLASHRMTLLNSIAQTGDASRAAMQLSAIVEEQINLLPLAREPCMTTDANLAFISFVTDERTQLLALRAALKKIEDSALRYRLSSSVASLQMDFDLLHSLVKSRLRE